MVPSPPGRNSRHCPRVRARAMAAFDYLIDSEYSGGPSGRSGEGEGALSLFNFLQISADGERGNGGGGGHRLRCEHVSRVCASRTCVARYVALTFEEREQPRVNRVTTRQGNDASRG